LQINFNVSGSGIALHAHAATLVARALLKPKAPDGDVADGYMIGIHGSRVGHVNIQETGRDLISNKSLAAASQFNQKICRV